MCGIAGILAPPGRDIDPATLASLGRRLAHRGPDDEGFLRWDGREASAHRDAARCVGASLAFVHRRLSILDLSAAGWQPMGTPDGRYWIVFNGEIYNFRELREELARNGRVFVSGSDTEVLLAAIEAWGTMALSRLVGMFAFALLDVRQRRLLLARDFFGIKPLYFARGPFGLAFASEIKALLEVPGISREADPARLYQYLRFGLTDHGARTMFAGIEQLPAAHLLQVPLDEPSAGTPRPFWSIDLARRSDEPFDVAAVRVRELFLESVSLHLRSDVPLGAALSGGIDSSAIVGAMRYLLGPRGDLHAVSYVADDPAISEERWIEMVAAAAGTHQHRALPEPLDLIADLDHLVETQDEPFGSTSIYAQHRVFRAARAAGLTVMLDGQGADEILAGYRPYLAARLCSLARGGNWLEAARFFERAAALPGVGRRALVEWLGGVAAPPALFELLRIAAGRPRFPSWLRGAWFEARGAAPNFPRARLGRNALADQLYFTVTTSSLPMLLRYEDRNSMAFSIESRVPFLVPALVEYLLALPEEYLLAPDGTSKSIFRAAMRGLVPDPVLDRRDKIGFATPERQWLGQLAPRVRETLADATARAIPALDTDAALAEWEAILAGSRAFDWRVWRWINVVRWTERYGVTYGT